MNQFLDRNFAKMALLIFSVLYFVDFFVANKISELFTLVPYKVTDLFEFWRVLTFPLASSSIEAFLLFFTTFYLIAPNLENSLNQKLFSKIVLLLTLLQGLIFCLVFFGSKLNFGGMEAISIFVLTFHTLRNKSNKARLFNKIEIPVYYITSMIFFVWLMFKANSVFLFHDFNVSYFFATIAFGLSTGFIINWRISSQERKYQAIQFDIHRWDLEEEDDEDDPYLAPALILHNESKKFNKKNEDDLKFNDWDFTPDEDKLNQILDKINDYGKDSLTQYEVEYLQTYSNQL